VLRLRAASATLSLHQVLAQPSADTMALRHIPTSQLTPYGTAVDIWAVGTLIHEALTGKVPFYHQEPSVMALKAQFGRPNRLPEGTLPECEAFVDAVLQQQAVKRPSAAQLLQHPWVRKHADAAAAAVAARVKANFLAKLQIQRYASPMSRVGSFQGCPDSAWTNSQ
jgi:serine/threonine protein kinase